MKKVFVPLTINEFELFEVMIDAAQGDISNGCEWVQPFKRQVQSLVKRKAKGKLASRKDTNEPR